MPVGGDDTEVTLMQSGFGASDLLGSKGMLQETGRRKWGSSSRRRWAVKRREGKQCPGTVSQRRRASSPRPVLVGSCLQGSGRGAVDGLRR